MRLLLIIPELSLKTPGGIATYYRNLIPVLRDCVETLDVLVANPYGCNTELWSCEGVHIEHVADDRLRRYRERFSHLGMFPFLSRCMAGAWAAYDHVEDKTLYDLVNVVDWGLPFVPWLLKSPDVPVVVTMHGSSGQISLHDPIAEYELEGFLTRLLESVFLACVRGIHTYSPANAEFWKKTLCRDVRCILPAFDALRHAQAAPGEEGLVVGRLQKWKDPQVVCRALTQLGDLGLKIRWVGRETPTLRKDRAMGSVLAEEFPEVFGQQLIHQSSLPYEEVRKLQASSAFNLIPSSWDMFNVTVVESLLSGRPTICSSGAGASSLIRHGENGFVFPAEDASALAAAVREVGALTEAEQARIADAAYQTVSEKLSPQKIGTATGEYFSKLLSDEGQGCQMTQEWIADFVSPDGVEAGVSDFLANIPIRQLAAQVVARGKQKLFSA